MRPWNIEEQTVREPATGLRFQFTSEHSLALEQGLPPPGRDENLLLRIFNETGTRIIELKATRGGMVTVTQVSPNLSGQVPQTEREELEAELRAPPPVQEEGPKKQMSENTGIVPADVGLDHLVPRNAPAQDPNDHPAALDSTARW
jgi:hypothetical protein